MVLPSRCMPRRQKSDPIAKAFGARVRALRQERGLTIEKLAYTIDEGSKGHLSSLERGLVMPTVETLMKLAQALEVLPADLVSDPEGSARENLIELSRNSRQEAIESAIRLLEEEKSG